MTAPVSFPWRLRGWAGISGRMSKRFAYLRLGAVEFRQQLEALGWPDGSQFAYVYGVPEDRVRKWMHGDEDIPPAVNLVVRLLQLPGARTLAIDVARATARPTEHTLEGRRKAAERSRGDA